MKRKQYSYEEKALTLKRHYVEKVPLSDLCDEVGMTPSMFYKWQKSLFENAPLALQKGRDKQVQALQKQVTDLEAKLAKKNEVVAELLEEHINLKKRSGAH